MNGLVVIVALAVRAKDSAVRGRLLVGGRRGRFLIILDEEATGILGEAVDAMSALGRKKHGHVWADDASHAIVVGIDACAWVADDALSGSCIVRGSWVFALLIGDIGETAAGKLDAVATEWAHRE